MIVLDQNTRLVSRDHWSKLSRAYECRIWLWPEQEGGFSVSSPVLKGLVTEGETLEDAVANAREAFLGLIAEYAETGTGIPWGEEEEPRPHGVIEKRILVNA